MFSHRRSVPLPRLQVRPRKSHWLYTLWHSLPRCLRRRVRSRQQRLVPQLSIVSAAEEERATKQWLGAFMLCPSMQNWTVLEHWLWPRLCKPVCNGFFFICAGVVDVGEEGEEARVLADEDVGECSCPSIFHCFIRFPSPWIGLEVGRDRKFR